MKKAIGALALGLVSASILIGGCNKGGSTSSGGNLAVVNGDAISMAEFNDYIPRKTSVQVQGPQGTQELRVAGSLGLQAMRDLINQKLLLQIAKDESVVPTDDDVAKELKSQQDRNPGFLKALTSAGLTLDQIRADLKIDLARFNVITKGITVTKDEVDKFIAANPSNFVKPATADLYWIVLKTNKNKALVDKDLKSGEQFPVVAGRYSDLPTARRDNGAYPSRIVEQMPQKLQDIAKKLKPGTATDWIKDGENSVKFYMQNQTAASKIPITDVIREQVRRRMAEDRGSQANDLGKTIQDRLRAAKIDVVPVYLRDSWKQAIDALKAADSTATPPPAP